MTLVEVLSDPSRLRAVARDGALLVEQEVARKRGLSGAAIKAGFATVKRVKPGFVERAMGALLPEFAPAVDPIFARARASGDIPAYFTAHADDLAEALLAVTDAKATDRAHPVLLRAYRGLRGRAHEQVVAAAPGLAELVTKHVP